MNAISVHRATSTDATALGALHVASWHETDPGLVPSDLLNDLSIDARSAMWGIVLDDTAGAHGVAVFVARSGGKIVGFEPVATNGGGPLRMPATVNLIRHDEGFAVVLRKRG